MDRITISITFYADFDDDMHDDVRRRRMARPHEYIHSGQGLEMRRGQWWTVVVTCLDI